MKYSKIYNGFNNNKQKNSLQCITYSEQSKEFIRILEDLNDVIFVNCPYNNNKVYFSKLTSNQLRFYKKNSIHKFVSWKQYLYFLKKKKQPIFFLKKNKLYTVTNIKDLKQKNLSQVLFSYKRK